MALKLQYFHSEIGSKFRNYKITLKSLWEKILLEPTQLLICSDWLLGCC